MLKTEHSYIGNLAVLVRLFYVWLIYNYAGHLIYNVAEIQHRSCRGHTKHIQSI